MTSLNVSQFLFMLTLNNETTVQVLKTPLALRKSNEYSGIRDAALKIYCQEGPRSFFRGYMTNILGIVPYAGIDLCVYEVTVILLYVYLCSYNSSNICTTIYI